MSYREEMRYFFKMFPSARRCKSDTLSIVMIIKEGYTEIKKVKPPRGRSFFWFVLFVCLSFFVPRKIVHSYGYVTITDDGLQILTNMYAWYLRPLSSEDFLACHTYCHIRLKWSSPRTRYTHTFCSAFVFMT